MFIVVIVYIYLCKKHCHLLCWVYKKKNLFSLFTPQFFIQKKIHKHPRCKMNGEQVKNLKFWVNILFEFPQSLFAATKIYILIFNLTHSLINLKGSFHFPQWKIFFPIHWQILKILGNGISQSFILSLKCDHPLLCEFSILFLTVKLKLGHKFSQLIHRFKLGFRNVSLGLCIFPSFSQFIK